MSNLPNGTTLQNGKFVLEKVLGQGSFGMTYRASTQMNLQGDLGSLKTTVNVAVKEFFMNEMNSRGLDGIWVEGSVISMVQNYRRKFRKEAENLSRLDHPNIVKVLSIFDENSTTYYVMEYLDGESLDQRITRKGYLEESEAVSVIYQVGSALQYMHQHQMLHLDLKPGNVMCANDGRIVLIDFGLSKQYDDKGEPESSTTLGLGTKGYAPIEQADYRQDGTFPATLDIYALGATFFKTLTGIRPLSASELLNDDSFLQRNLSNAGVSPHTIAVVCKAMAYRRKDRFQTVEEFLQALSSSGSLCDEKTELASPQTEETDLSRPSLTAKSQQLSHSSLELESPVLEVEVEPVQSPTANNLPKAANTYEKRIESEQLLISNGQQPIANSPKTKPRKGLVVGIVAASLAALLTVVLILIFKGGNSEYDNPDERTKLLSKNRVENMKTVEGLWTGSVTRDGVMEGQGELRYFENDKDGRSTYTGEMKGGIRDGNGVLVYKNGTRFEGTLKDDMFVNGEFRIPAKNAYFIGTYKDNSPYEGEWFYISTNKKFANVVNGQTKVLN